jgi:hypothetical protein
MYMEFGRDMILGYQRWVSYLATRVWGVTDIISLMGFLFSFRRKDTTVLYMRVRDVDYDYDYYYYCYYY